MTKFFEWFDRNRKAVGYTVGTMNILVGLNHFVNADAGLAVLWLVIGTFLIWDAYAYTAK